VDGLLEGLRDDAKLMQTSVHAIVERHLLKQELLIRRYFEGEEPQHQQQESGDQCAAFKEEERWDQQSEAATIGSNSTCAEDRRGPDVIPERRPEERDKASHSCKALTSKRQELPGGRIGSVRFSSAVVLGRARTWLWDLGMENTADDFERWSWKGALFRFVDWWTELKDPSARRSPRFHQWLYSRSFQSFCALVILSNAIFEVYTTDYEIKHLEVDPADTVLWVVDSFYLGFYMVELFLKLLLHREYFFCNEDTRWNIFDLVLVSSSSYAHIVHLVSGSKQVADLSFVRSVRILKLAKVLRIVRMLRLITELRLLMNSVLGSIMSLFWSLVVLLFVLYIFALIFVQGVANHTREAGETALDELTDEYFGRVYKAMLSLYMAATGGNDWVVFYEVIAQTGRRNAILFLMFMLFIQIAVLNVVTGIFVENAMKFAEPDHEAIAQDKRRKDKFEAEHLTRLCCQMDTDYSGSISLEEFRKAYMTRKEVRSTLSGLGLDIQDAEVFFNTLSCINDKKHVNIESFVTCCLRLRGAATSIDLQNMELHTRSRLKRLDDKLQALLTLVVEGNPKLAFPEGRSSPARVSAQNGSCCAPLDSCSRAAVPSTRGRRRQSPLEPKRAWIRMALLCSNLDQHSSTPEVG